MEYTNKGAVPDDMVFCKIFQKDIANGLCFEISNIGNDSLNLPPEEKPPCGWEQAHKICDTCEYYF